MLKKEVEQMLKEQSKVNAQLAKVIASLRIKLNKNDTEIIGLKADYARTQRELRRAIQETNSTQITIERITRQNKSLHNKLVDKSKRKKRHV